MSFSLKQYFWNMVLGRGVEGNETVRKGEGVGVQGKEPRAKVLCRPGLFMELKLKAWQAVHMRQQPKGEGGGVQAEGNRLENGKRWIWKRFEREAG